MTNPADDVLVESEEIGGMVLHSFKCNGDDLITKVILHYNLPRAF